MKAMLREFLLQTLALCNIPGNPHRADHVSVAVDQWQFGRQDPTLASVRPRLLLFFLQNRLACADDLLFICEGTLRMLLAEHVKIRLVDCLAGIAESEAGRQRAADPDKPAVTVFEIDPVRDVF